MKDLFADNDLPLVRYNGNGSRTSTKAAKIIDAVYSYADEEGVILYENVRYRPKDFRQRRPDGNGGYIYNLEGIDRVPYCLPELLERLATPDAEIWLAEGEKDADNLRSIGFYSDQFQELDTEP
ncbi:MAG: hypothetical protein IPI76_17455 [Chloracidobacterium sp.]|nr:hypothetical protein [Chloracidobacterium sp.]